MWQEQRKILCSVWQKQHCCCLNLCWCTECYEHASPWYGCIFQATDCGHSIYSAPPKSQKSWLLRAKIDGWMEGAVEGVCKSWFKKQKRVLRLDFWGAGRLSAFSNSCGAHKFKKAISALHHRHTPHWQTTSNSLHLHAHLTVWLERTAQAHTDGLCFMRCQKKGFGEIKEEREKVIASQRKSAERRPASETPQMSFLTKRIVKNRHTHTQSNLIDWLTGLVTNKSQMFGYQSYKWTQQNLEIY